MGDPAEKLEETPEEEKLRLLRELNILSDRRDAITEAIDHRKERVRDLMNDAGERTVESEYHGGAGFSPRRSFKVLDRAVLEERCPPSFLARGFKPTAALVDALSQKGISIEGMIAIGVNESFAYKRPTTAEAEERRRSIIAEARELAERKVAEIVASI